MPTSVVPIGIPTVLAQNVIFALPARAGFVMSAFPFTAVLQVCMTEVPASFQPITVDAEGNFFTTAPFIRCTDVAGCTVTLKVR